MSPTFWGLLVLAFAIVVAAAAIRGGLAEIARGLDARNALLSLIRKQHGPRMAALHDGPGPERRR